MGNNKRKWGCVNIGSPKLTGIASNSVFVPPTESRYPSCTSSVLFPTFLIIDFHRMFGTFLEYKDLKKKSCPVFGSTHLALIMNSCKMVEAKYY